MITLTNARPPRLINRKGYEAHTEAGRNEVAVAEVSRRRRRFEHQALMVLNSGMKDALIAL